MKRDIERIGKALYLVLQDIPLCIPSDKENMASMFGPFNTVFKGRDKNIRTSFSHLVRENKLVFRADYYGKYSVQPCFEVGMSVCSKTVSLSIQDKLHLLQFQASAENANDLWLALIKEYNKLKEASMFEPATYLDLYKE